jgi:putative chitinase
MTDVTASAGAPALPQFGPALRKLWPHADMHIPGLTAAMVDQAPALFEKSGITTEMEVANMMGEFTEECGGGFEVEENLNYRASQLHSQWPLHFSLEQALEMQHQPALIANQAYNGRMGNRPGTNDGWNYRGRGPAQTTGRDAYGVLGEAIKLDLINHPELINDARYFLACGVIDFVVICKCLIYAQRDDEVNETRHLNGGLIGLGQREASIKMWKHMLGVA